MTQNNAPPPVRSFWRSLRRNPMGLVGAVMLLLAIFMAVFAPLLAPYDPYEPVKVTVDDIYAPPSLEHLLGTDDAGKDVLSNFIYGARVSLIVGFFASFISIASARVVAMGFSTRTCLPASAAATTGCLWA